MIEALRYYANSHLDTGSNRVHQTHFVRSGNGLPIILLHPSPLSSQFMLPVVSELHGVVTAIAPDTPGYGQSDPLPRPAQNLEPYVDWLKAFVESLGYSSVGLYGSATGAQIAIEFARTYPDMSRYVILDNAVHFTDTEREEIMARYFPDMTPKADGSHLDMAWEMSNNLFRYFPWYDQREESRVSEEGAPLPAVHATAMAYLVAGEDYDMAYRAAFKNEDARNMQQIKVPTRVIRWSGSMLKQHADRLDEFDWPDNIRMVQCGAGATARFAAIRAQVEELAHSG